MPIRPRVLVLYYSSYGHVETLAQAACDGAREAGALVDLKRVSELVPPSVAERAGYNRPHRLPGLTSWPTTTRSCSARRHASARWRPS